MITFIFVCFTRRLNVTGLSPILYNLACVVDGLNPSLWTVIYSLRVLYLRKPRVISPTATQAVITTVFCICSIGSSLLTRFILFYFFICSSQKCKMKTETTKLYIKQSILFFCKFATLISQDRSRLTTSAVQSITATSLFAWFCFCFDFCNDHRKTHLIYESVKYKMNFYRVFSLPWPASMQIYRNKGRRLYTKIEFNSYMIG